MSWPRITATVSGALAILLGFAVLLGWAIHSPLLVQISPNLAPMQRNTAAAFVWLGLALLALAFERRRLNSVASAVVALISGLTLVEYGFHLDLRVDQL